jgi:aspartate racemase
MPEKIIGILGGMGPEATIDLFTKIVKGTRVQKDQDHLRILIDNNPKIPDRTLAIQGEGPSPLNQLT